MALKRKAVGVKFEQPRKQQKKQSDLAAGFAAQILRSPRKAQAGLASQRSDSALELDDSIEISSDEDRHPLSQRAGSQAVRSDPGGRLKASSELATKARPSVPISASFESQRLVCTGKIGELKVSSSTQTDEAAVNDVPWIDRVPLRKSADLAVHKKKVSDVQAWIQASFENVTRKTVLILSGPAGVGKSATVETLALEMDFNIIEWRNPMSVEWLEGSYDREADSLAQKFERFLAISDKYSALDFGHGSDNTDDQRRKIILVEDLPNTFSSSSSTSSAKLTFQNSIKRYLASPRNKYPLVLIVTETEPRGEDGDWRRSDAMSVRNLLTREILDSQNASQIAFNDVAPTFISKALGRIVDGLPRTEAVEISQAVLDEIAQTANGDIRSAINTLQFISHRFRTHGRLPKSRRRKKRGEILTLTAEEASILNTITNRESALGYFHAIGKVIYNKRIPTSLDPIKFDMLPSHLLHETRGRPENNPSTILDETSTDIPTFLMGIHQNYIDSCTDLEQVSGVIDALGTSDVSTHGFHRDFFSAWTIAGTSSVAGTLHALPQNATRSHAQKVYYPAFGKLIHAQSAIRDVIQSFNEDDNTHTDTASVTFMTGSIGTIAIMDRMSYAYRIDQEAAESLRSRTYLKKAVTFDRYSTFGRGGSDQKQGIVVEDDNHSNENTKRTTTRLDQSMLDDRDRAAGGPSASIYEEVMDDDIEEV